VTLGMGGSRGFHRDQTLLQYSPLCSRGHVGAAQPAVGRGICRLLLCLREWRGTPLHFRRSSTPRVASSDPSSGHSFKPICPGTGSAGPNSSSAGSSRSCTSSFRRHEPRCFSTARPVGGGRTASRTCTVRTRCASTGSVPTRSSRPGRDLLSCLSRSPSCFGVPSCRGSRML
jgi:hypothetical protein